MTCKELTWGELGMTVEAVFLQMGYGGSKARFEVKADEATLRETQSLMDRVGEWLRPQFCYTVVREIPGNFRMGAVIERELRGSGAFAFFICTAGSEYEAFMRQLKDEGDMLRVFIADAIGSVIAEHCADAMERHLQASIDKLHWHHTNRFSPGYCGWHVSQQQLLFPIFQGNTCGVTLTDSSLMVPIKSVSGIIGLGTEVHRHEYACALCNNTKCYQRKAPSY